MRGLIFKGDRMIELADLPTPAPGPMDVVVEVRASGLCGSDIPYYRLGTKQALTHFGFDSVDVADVVAGHEPCGEIVAIGSEVDHRTCAIGDRVMVFHYSGCGSCEACQTGWFQMCESGPDIYGATAHGGHAEYIKVPAATVVPMPDSLSFTAGAAISCGTGTAYSALCRMNLTARDTIAIFGMGPVGQSAVMFAVTMGARVIALDVDHSRLETAEKLGALATVNSLEQDPVEAVKELTNGRGGTTALDCSGAASARSAAVQSVRPWGRVVFVGEGGEVTLDVSRDVIRKQLHLMGSYTFSLVRQRECAEFVDTHSVPVDRIFSHRWPLEQGAEAYSEFEKQAGGKAVFEM